MRHFNPLGVLLSLPFFCGSALGQGTPTTNAWAPASQDQVYFTENKGQVHDGHHVARADVLFMGITPAQQCIITSKGMSHQLVQLHGHEVKGAVQPIGHAISEHAAGKLEVARVDMEWVNASTTPTAEAFAPLAGHSNYYNVPSAPKGILGVRHFGEVRLHDIYPGIDARFYGQGDAMEYDYEVAMGADHRQIRIRISGTAAKLNRLGQLELSTPLGIIAESAPKVMQGGKELTSRWVQLEHDVWGFEIEGRDLTMAMVIDPIVAVRSWGTYYGGLGNDWGVSSAIDGNDNVYMVGQTTSAEAIATAGSHQQTFGGGTYDAYLVKFDSDGVRLWATYYGGSGDEQGTSCAVNVNGDIHLLGYTTSAAGIATAGSHQETAGGSYDAFLVKFDGDGVRQWATYYGGTGVDLGNACAVAANGSIHLVGSTNTVAGITTVGSHQEAHNGGTWDAYLVQFDSDGIRQWSTYLGGDGIDLGQSCAVDGSGNVLLAGYTGSAGGIATVGGHQEAHAGGTWDPYVVKFNSSGIRQWGTYYGGAGANETGSFCTADASGNIYLTGYSDSDAGIATVGCHQEVRGGGDWDAYLVKFDASGSRQWGTYFGGEGNNDAGTFCTTDGNGDVYLAGFTESAMGIAMPSNHQATYGGGGDGYLVKFNGSGTRQWSTYYGGNGSDVANACGVDGNGNVYLIGTTASASAIATAGSHQSAYGGASWDGFIVRFGECETSSSTLAVEICDSYSAPDGQVYTESGQYIAIIPNVAGCDSTITIDLIVNVAITPVITANGPTDICVGGDVTLTSSAAEQYAWTPDGQSEQAVTVTPGTYAVTITDANGCEATSAPTEVQHLAPYPNVPICLVTVDSTSLFNIIAWEKPMTTAIDSFYVYREMTTNNFQKIGAVAYDSLSLYNDLTANPNETSYRYRLSVLDTCGQESSLGLYHSTIHLLHLGSGNLFWTHYGIEGQPNPVEFYRVYRDDLGTGDFQPISSTVPGGNSTYTDVNASSFPTAEYLIDVTWSISCTATRADVNINTTRSNVEKAEIAVGLADAAAFEFSMFPNPASSSVTLVMPRIATTTLATLRNAMGQDVMQVPVQGGTNELPLHGLANGMYALQIGSSVKRLMIVSP